MASSVIKFSAILMFIVVCTAAISPAEFLVTEVCLSCICQAASGCRLSQTCSGDTCGLFRITLPYWIDAGKPRVPGDSESTPERTAYQNCSLDPHCAALTVQSYMKNFAQDCNGDGQVNCYDYMAIHQMGGYNCMGNLPIDYARNFNQCIAAVTTLHI